MRVEERRSKRTIAFLIAACIASGCGLNAGAQVQQTIGVANGDVAGLINAINQLNSSGGGTIELAGSGLYQVSTPSSWWYGPNAFPAIASAITIQGNGATILRGIGNPPPFRFFYVSGGMSGLPKGALTLIGLNLTGGYALGGNGGDGTGGGGGGAGMGGAVFNQGDLFLDQVTLNGNEAVGGQGGAAVSDSNSFLFYGGGGGGMSGNGGSGNVWPFDNGSGGGGGGMNGDAQMFGYGGGFLGNEGGVPGGGSGTYGGYGAGSVGCWLVDSTDCQPTAGSGGGGYALPPAGNGSQPVYSASQTVSFAGAPGGYGGGSGGNVTYGPIGFPPPGATWSAGGAFGGGGEGSSAGAGGGGGVGGGGGGGGGGNASAGGFAEGNWAVGDGGEGGFGGGGGGGGGGLGPGFFNYGKGGIGVFGGGVGGFGIGGVPGTGGDGMGGAIFNQGGTVYLWYATFVNNAANGPPSTQSQAYGQGGAIFNANGTVWITNSNLEGDSATDSNGYVGEGSEIYSTSNRAANLTPCTTTSSYVNAFGSTYPSQSVDLVSTTGTATFNQPPSSYDLAIAAFLPDTLNFGTVYVGTTISQTLTLMNAGAANLTLSSVQLTGSNLFSITANNCPSSLGPGAGCQIVVTFSSKVVGQPAAQLVFTDNGSANNYYPATQQTVNLLANVVQWPFTVQLAFGIAPQAVV